MLNKISKQTFILLFTLVLLGGFLRYYKFTENPVSLNIDEVSVGYNAYSILKTGKDEYGEKFPLSFRSVGDYKPPVSIYLTVPSIALFGLNEFGVRFPAVFLSTLSIIIYYFFFKYFIKDRKYALLSTALVTISPWYLYYSRYATTEFLFATLFASLGILGLLKMLEGKRFWSFGAAFALSISMYTYHTERLFVPLFIAAFTVLNWREILIKRRTFLMFISLFVILSAPLAYSTILGPDRARAEATFITKDVELIRSVILEPVDNNSGLLTVLGSLFGGDIVLLFFYWARKFLAYFQPSFLFYNSLNMTTQGTYGLGILYLFELPWLILGIITLIRNKIPNRSLILFWIILGILPASLTINEQHPSRTLVIFPMVALLSGIGGVVFFQQIKRLSSAPLKMGVYAVFAILLAWSLLHALMVFTAYFPRQRGESFMEGTKEAVEYALENRNQYDEIVFDPVRGVEGPYIVSIPHMYILFYSQYDPAKYQNEIKRGGDELYGFDKFTIRKINWRIDRAKSGTLFIGSPWTLPLQDIKEEDILKRINLKNGKLAFLIVSPTSPD